MLKLRNLGSYEFGLFDCVDEESMILRNVGNVSNYYVTKPKRHKFLEKM